MSSQHSNWIATTSARTGVLYACKRLPRGGLRLDEVARIDNTHEGEHDRGRPVMAGGAERAGAVARSGAHAAPHAVAAGHTAEEERRRFAREVADWLARERKQRGCERLALFAPAQCLGLLREQMAGWANPPDSFEGDLARLHPNELATHPAVLEAVHGRPE